jgi:hypothetical protein
MTDRAIYERLKKEFLGKMSALSQQRAEAHERKKHFVNYDDTLSKLLQHADEIAFTKRGTPEPESVRIILEDNFNIALNDIETKRLIKRGIIRHPESFKKSD